MRFIYLLFSCVFFANLSFAQTFDLSFKLDQDETYRQVTHSESEITQEFEGEVIKVLMELDGIMNFQVKEITDNSFNFDVSYEELGFSVQNISDSNHPSKLSFSSKKNDPNDIFSLILSSIIDENFEVIMTSFGRIQEVKNVEKLWDSAINQFEDIPEMQRNQIKAQIMQNYGDESLKGNIEMITAIYPDHPVKLGDKWTIHTQIKSQMRADVITEYELVEIAADYILIKGVSSISTDEENAYMESDGTRMKFDLSGSMYSEIKVDKITGWVLEAKVSQAFSGDNYILNVPNFPDGMKIPMSFTTETIITN